jgi:hypothetical protein
MSNNQILTWLLEGDVSIQYQVHRDLLGEERPDLKNRIGKEGWGKQFLSKQLDNGHWGRSFYQPKWISTHYTLLDLRHLELPPGNPQVDRAINLALEQEKGADGGIKVHADSSHITQSDVCVNGMFLNYACHFKAPEKPLESVVDFILSQRMKDGGFNCRRNRSGARHSSLHSTLSVAEGIRSYYRNGYEYRLPELLEAEKSSQEFMLLHQLYISDRTGKIIKKDFLRLTFPGRWKYDILRALDYFQWAEAKYDPRMEPAFQVLLKKRRKDGRWNVQAKYSGQVHFEMEKAGQPSRWNTLRALRVLKHFKNLNFV